MALTAKKVYAILNGKIKKISGDVSQISTPLFYAGTVATANALPTAPRIGAVYNIEQKSIYGEAGMNVAWNGSKWDSLGPAIDTSLLLTKEEAEQKYLKTIPQASNTTLGGIKAKAKTSEPIEVAIDQNGKLYVPNNKTPVDATLTRAGQAADAKKVGDEIGNLKQSLGSLTSPLIFAGTIETAEALPVEKKTGDVYSIKQKSTYGEAGTNVAWNGKEWVALGETFDLSHSLHESHNTDKNAHEDIRQGLTTVKNDFTKVEKSFEIPTIEESGYLNANGTLIEANPTSLEKTTSYIAVETNDELYFSMLIDAKKSMWLAVSEYDKDKRFLKRVGIVNNETTTEISSAYKIQSNNTHFIRISYRTYGLGVLNIKYDIVLHEKMQEIYGKIEEAKAPILLKNSNVKSINHRGYNTVAPENTLSAYKLSKKMGFDYVETDIAFTSDGVPVLLHDWTVDRTSNGTGAANTFTLEQIKMLDFGSWKDAKYAGEKIPTFEEFLLLCKQIGLKAYAEIKSGATEMQIKQLLEIARKYGMEKHITWISFNEKDLTNVKNNDSKARLGYVVNEINQTVVDNAKLLKTQDNEVFIDVAFGKITDESVKMCLDSNLPLEVWTVNSITNLKNTHHYVTGYTSDSLVAGEALLNEFI